MIFDNRSTDDSLATGALRVETATPEWTNAIRDTAYIYGLEMLAIVVSAFPLGETLRNATAKYYIDNSNFRDP